MIIIGIGANLSQIVTEMPRATCGRALTELSNRSINVLRCSSWVKTAPVPVSDVPWYVNAVAELETSLKPNDLLAELLEVELMFGRQRSVPNAPRTIDLDLICYHDVMICETKSPSRKVDLNLPHPRMHERAFVLLPLQQLDANWVHPVTGTSIDELISRLPEDQEYENMDDADGLFLTEFKINIA